MGVGRRRYIERPSLERRGGGEQHHQQLQCYRSGALCGSGAASGPWTLTYSDHATHALVGATCCEPMPCTAPHDCPHQRRRSWSMGGVASPEQVADSRNAKPVRMHQFGPRDARRGRSCSTVNVCREVCHAASRVVRKGAVGVAAIETRREARAWLECLRSTQDCAKLCVRGHSA